MDDTVKTVLAEFIETASETVKIAQEQVEQYRISHQQAAKLADDLVTFGARSGIFLPDQLKTAEALLNSHAGAVQVAQVLAQKVAKLAEENEKLRGGPEHKTAAEPGRAAADPTNSAKKQRRLYRPGVDPDAI